MFNRYWREYPWFMQLILFGLMVFTMASFSIVVLNVLVPRMWGYNLAGVLSIDKNSPAAMISAFLFVQGVSSTFTFIIPAVLFAYLTLPAAGRFLGLVKPQRGLHILLGILVMIGAMPLVIEIATLLKTIKIDSALEAQNKIEEATNAILNIKTPAQLLKVLVVVAIIPAIGEELFFRGVLLRFGHQKAGKMLWPIIVTSILFAAVHGTPYNFISIMLSGVLLCIIYYWTGSLWCGIAAHCVYNGLQVYLSYLSKDNAALKVLEEGNHMPIGICFAGAVLMSVSLYMLWKTRNPLPANWSDNFTAEEFQARQHTNNT